jgi:hypothetical protein
MYSLRILPNGVHKITIALQLEIFQGLHVQSMYTYIYKYIISSKDRLVSAEYNPYIRVVWACEH